MRRRTVIGLGLLAVAGLELASLLAYCLYPRSPRPCLNTFVQVREGMSFDDVCATVGGPPGDYTNQPPTFYEASERSSNNSACWEADDASLVVHFDKAGRAFLPIAYGPEPPSPFLSPAGIGGLLLLGQVIVAICLLAWPARAAERGDYQDGAGGLVVDGRVG